MSDDYRRRRDLSRERQVFVRSATALANHLHTYVDRLFPHFLDAKKSATPLGAAEPCASGGEGQFASLDFSISEGI